MRKSGVKTVSILQIVVMLISIIIPIIIMCPTKVIAQNSNKDRVEQMESGKERIFKTGDIIGKRTNGMGRKKIL